MKTKPSFYRLTLIVVLLALLSGACNFLTGTEEPPTPAPTATRGFPADTATPAPPTATPGPTPTPMPYPAPRLLFRTPENGETLALTAPIELVFDQPMDQESVAGAFNIEPEVKGAFAWNDARTLVFKPTQSLARAASYRVTVGKTARNAEGLPLPDAVSFDFQTVGYLEVSEVQPAPDVEGLDPDAAVIVVFNRPVVPLTSLDRQSELPQPLQFTPPIAGAGEWINTSIYRFRAEGGFKPATEYQVSIDAALTDTTGNTLKEAYTWYFSTQQPKVLAVYPRRNAEHVAPGAVISITFNQPMDHASVEKSFQLKINNQPVAGTFRWGVPVFDDYQAPAYRRAETMGFVPDAPLPRNATGTAALNALVYAKGSQVAMKEEVLWTFRTVLSPGIVSVSPANGAINVKTSTDVRITFASPMQTDGIMDYITILPEPTRVYTYWSDFYTELRLSFPMEPQTTYQVTLSADAPDRYGEVLGTPLNLRFSTGDLTPYLSLNTGGSLGVFNAYTPTAVYASYRNIQQVGIALYRLSPETFVKWHGSEDYQFRRNFVPEVADLVRGWTINVSPPRNQSELRRLEMVTEDGAQLPPGAYYLIVSSPQAESYSKYSFIRSHLNLTLKQTNHETLVWATDLSTGQPAPGLDVTLYSSNQEFHQPGVTDADGMVWVQQEAAVNLWNDFFAFSGTPGAATFGVAYNNWDNGIRPWNFNLMSDYGDGAYAAYLYTDRPIYRPGQTVYFKGIVRADDDAHYTIPADITEVRAVIQDSEGQELYNETLPVNEMGTFNGELALDEAAALGTYYIQVDGGERDFYTSASFRLAEYRKPEFQVSVQTDKDAYFGGDVIAATAEATYYFGGPVANADVHWNVLSGDYWFDYDCPRGEKCPWYSWRDYQWEERTEPTYGSYGRLIAEGDGVTDNEGRAAFEIPADLSGETNSRQFTIEANVTDINDQYVSARASVVVHKGDFYIGVAPRGYLSKMGEPKSVDLITVDKDSAPVSGVTLQVIFMDHRWYSVREQADDGQFYWTWEVEDVPIFTTTATTDPSGKAVAAFTPPESGSYRVRASGVDARGNEIRSSAYLWVWGGRARWRQESTNRIDLIPDQDDYEVGDVAEILIPSPYSGTVKALVTIERGHILQREVRELRTNTEVLRVPITEDYAPNIFVSVVIVQGQDQAADGLASFKMGTIQLPVSIKEKALQITLTPDRTLEEGGYYHPRDTAIYDVLVTDYAGQPVQAELSLRLADLAVLALADETGPTLLERYWSQRGLNVRTATPLVLAMEAYNRELAPQAKGGGGGESDSGFIRTEFADTAYWNPVVRTDANGQAKVEVKLPDNLTTWRMQARGITVDTLVGRSEVDILSTLDLLVRPVLPRFFVVGDRAEIGTIVHNNTGQALATDIILTAAGLDVSGPTYQTVDIPAGDKVRVDWPVTVLPGAEVRVRMEAEAGAYRDGVELTLPVYRYSTPEVMATAGRLSEPELRQELVQLPRSFDPTQGELTVQVDGSLTSATADSLKYLETYPYECVEQTVSRFLPNVLTYQALQEMGLARPELKAHLEEQIGKALQKLYAYQHYDGGWGWWESDWSSVYLTTYALHGMLEAYRAGFTVDVAVIEDGVAYLRENLGNLSDASYWQANRQAYQLYVLSEYLQLMDGAEPEGEVGYAIRLFEKREKLSHYGKAMLAVALGLLEPGVKSRANALMADFAGEAIYSATGTHWEESYADYWNMNTDIRTTAIIMWAMARHMPDSDLLPNVARWLMSVRQSDAFGRRYWESTYTTSWVMMGLISYMRATGEMQGDFSYTVNLNGEVILMGDINQETLDESQRVQVEIARLLAEEGNRLLIERQSPTGGQTGAGQLYYTAHLRYFLPAADVKAAERGIVVARRYERVGEEASERISEASIGDLILVKLTVVAPTNLYYVVVEDPLPAGCEAVDLGLETTSVVGEAPGVHNLTAEEEDYWYWRYGWGWWWFSHSEVRDEKVALFAAYLPRGTYEYSYVMRASLAGTYNVIPTTAYEMYFPEVWGRSDGGQFVVKGAE